MQGSQSKAVICLSGGMDSCVCAALAARDYEVYALHFSYGQRTEARELEAAREVARLTGIAEFMHLRIDLFRRIGGSALTDAAIAVPDASQHESRIGAEIPVTYVPFRNAHFLSAAVSWAEVLGAKTIVIGAVEQDSSGYPDCRPEYYEAFNELIRRGTKEGDIRVETPVCGFSLLEYAGRTPESILLRTAAGAVLGHDPWDEAGGVSGWVPGVAAYR